LDNIINKYGATLLDPASLPFPVLPLLQILPFPRVPTTTTYLTGGIPDLKLDGLSVEVDGADLKVDSNGGDVRLGVSVIGETEEETRLTDTRI